MAHAQLFHSAAREKVLRGATMLADALSVAGVLLLTEATLAELPEPKQEAPAAPGLG